MDIQHEKVVSNRLGSWLYGVTGCLAAGPQRGLPYIAMGRAKRNPWYTRNPMNRLRRGRIAQLIAMRPLWGRALLPIYSMGFASLAPWLRILAPFGDLSLAIASHLIDHCVTGINRSLSPPLKKKHLARGLTRKVKKLIFAPATDACRDGSCRGKDFFLFSQPPSVLEMNFGAIALI